MIASSVQKEKEQVSRQQQLTTIIKDVRDKLPKIFGFSESARDCLPQLIWLLLLKYIEDYEQLQEASQGDEHTLLIESPYRWRDWVVDESVTQRKKGDDLLEFINNGLFPYLSRLSGPAEQDLRSVLGSIFQSINTRIRDGYILREAVNQLST